MYDICTTLWEFGPQKGPNSLCYMEPKMRFELTTYALRVRCSTPELPGRVIRWLVYCRHFGQHLGIHTSSTRFWMKIPCSFGHSKLTRCGGWVFALRKTMIES